MSNSKSIGNTYERSVAKKLSLWLSEGQNDDVCWRDLGSGSRATIRGKQGKDTTRHGDFVPTDLSYKYFFDRFCMDSKSYKEWNPIFINEKNMKSNSILNQWVKVIEESQDKIPMMICNIRDRKTPEFVVLPSATVYPKDCNINLMYYSFSSKINIKDFCLILLDDFFHKVSAKEFYYLNS